MPPLNSIHMANYFTSLQFHKQSHHLCLSQENILSRESINILRLRFSPKPKCFIIKLKKTYSVPNTHKQVPLYIDPHIHMNRSFDT